MVKAVIFDIDGTLIDSVDAHAASWSEAFRHFGFDVDKSAVRQKIGMRADFLLRDFLDSRTIARHGRILSPFVPNYSKRIIFLAFRDFQVFARSSSIFDSRT